MIEGNNNESEIYKKRWLPLLATTTCLAVILAACGGGSGSESAGSSTPAVENEYKEKYDPAVTITTAWGIDPELKFKNGESMENNVATKWAKDKFGIEIKSLWSVTDTNNAFATKLRLAMSSGQEMPDVVTVGDNLLAQDLIDSGMYQEVGPLFDKYASDTWKKAMEQDPNVWNQYSRDGKRMGIPVLDYAYNNDYLLWIRQDWLDKLNMKAPKRLTNWKP